MPINAGKSSSRTGSSLQIKGRPWEELALPLPCSMRQHEEPQLPALVPFSRHQCPDVRTEVAQECGSNGCVAWPCAGQRRLGPCWLFLAALVILSSCLQQPSPWAASPLTHRTALGRPQRLHTLLCTAEPSLRAGTWLCLSLCSPSPPLVISEPPGSHSPLPGTLWPRIQAPSLSQCPGSHICPSAS